MVPLDTSLWGLLSELSTQLSANRERCEELKKQCEQLKVSNTSDSSLFWPCPAELTL